MKKACCILLFLVTAIYVLPVRETLRLYDHICLADMDETKEDTGKKFKTKDLFFPFISQIPVTDSYTFTHRHRKIQLPVSIHQVETPPPNKG